MAWRLGEFEEVAFRTTIVNAMIEVGDAGMRLVGLAWLVAFATFVAAATDLWRDRHRAATTIAAATAVSTAICIVGLPASGVGLGIDVSVGLVLAGWIVLRARDRRSLEATRLTR